MGERRVNPDRESFGKSIFALATALGFDLDRAVISVYWHALRELPGEIRTAMFLKASEQRWFKFPQPAQLKTIASELVAERRKTAFWNSLPPGDTCPDCRGSRWRSVVVNEVERLERCPCWQAALKAADRVGQAIALPASREDAIDMSTFSAPIPGPEAP